jgi:multidrug efflux pump subunit AcrA (membrane-fusion protein)
VTPDDATPYRQIALERLSSPEQLDQVLQVTHLRSWLALTALGVLLLMALVWSVVGTIPTKISAPGMLIRPGGLFDLFAPGEGNVVDVLVKEGQVVEKGQVVARLNQPSLAAEVEDARIHIAGMTAGSDERREAERALAVVEQRLATASLVRSPHPGRILEIKVRPGDVVGRGAPIVSLQLADQEGTGIQAVVYVPAANGKSVLPGMPVQISPTTAAREEYGFLIGRVTYVSEFPSTREGMMRVLANEGLVANLSAQGAPFAVWAELLPDPSSRSGYRWSSSKGSQLTVNSGTLCEVFITTREQRPIELVLPLLRQASGL